MRKSRTPGSVRGVSGNGYPYRDIFSTKLRSPSILYFGKNRGENCVNVCARVYFQR